MGGLRRLSVAAVGILAIICAGLGTARPAVGETVAPRVLVGSYAYEDVGGTSRTVRLPAGWGRPDALLVQTSTPGPDNAARLRTADMAPGLSKDLSKAEALAPGGIEAFGVDSFTVHADLNAPGATYGFVAIRGGNGAVDDYFAHGAYTGTGEVRDVALGGGAGWRPDLVIVAGDTARPAVYHTGSMGYANDLSYKLGATAKVDNAIRRLGSGEFEVGSDSSVNGTGTVYAWLALREIPAVFEQGFYIGTSGARAVALDDGFKPDYVFASRLHNLGHHRFGHLPEFPADSSQDLGNAPTGGFDGTSSTARRYVKSFEIESFSVGRNLSVFGSTYHFWAFRSTPVPSAEVDVDAPAPFRVFQRGVGDTADIAVSGAYSGTPSAIEARWNGGAWTVIDASPTGGRFAGVLADQDSGGGALEVRARNIPASVEVIDPVGVGDVFVVAGQSNASGFGSPLQPAPGRRDHGAFAGLFGNDDRWKELADPIDSGVDQIDIVSRDPGSGTWVPHLAATLLADSDGVPVAFVPSAKSASSIVAWSRSLLPETLYGNMHRRLTAIGNGDPVGAARAVLWFQGEHEANRGRSTAEYAEALEQLARNVSSDFGTPLVVAGLVDIASTSGTNLDRIRAAQRLAVEADAEIVSGAQHYDIDLDDSGGDGIHLGSADDPHGSDELTTSARRWWATIDGIVHGAHDGRGPVFDTAELDANRTSILVTVLNDRPPLRADGPLTTSAWRVGDDVGEIAVVAAEIVGDGTSNRVRLDLARAAGTDVSLAFAAGHSGAGGVVPTDSQTSLDGTPARLPLEPFDSGQVTTDTPPPGDAEITLRYSGYHSYSNTGTVTGGALELTNSILGTIGSVAGSVTIPGVDGGHATVSINARSLLPWIPLYLGSIDVVDANAGFAAHTPLLFSRIYRMSPTSVRGRAVWYVLDGLSARVYELVWQASETG